MLRAFTYGSEEQLAGTFTMSCRVSGMKNRTRGIILYVGIAGRSRRISAAVYIYYIMHADETKRQRPRPVDGHFFF